MATRSDQTETVQNLLWRRSVFSPNRTTSLFMSWPETLNDIRRKGMTSTHLRTGRNVAMDTSSLPAGGLTSDVLAGIASELSPQGDKDSGIGVWYVFGRRAV